MAPPSLPPPTRESIKAAFDQMLADRAEVERQVPGLIIRADGTIVLPQKVH